MKRTNPKRVLFAVIAVLFACLFGCIDLNPISKEDILAATEAIEQDVYWAKSGRTYHLYEDCQTIANVDRLYCGSVESAIDARHDYLCGYCAMRAGIDDPAIRIEKIDGR
ncbi:MAG: hypothetical protein IK118_08050 [Clostridia bacterium]|nr:hypothetical protein [Clostridia bacterium]